MHLMVEANQSKRYFEKVEIKPQALEWLFAKSCGRPFRVSLDNLTGDSGDGTAFKDNVFAQVQTFLNDPQSIPKDGFALIQHLCEEIRDGKFLEIGEFQRSDLD